jgi:hypothetical protein
MKDQFKITILENGITKAESDNFSGPVHQIAEGILLWIQKELGGDMQRIRKSSVHTHTHEHGEEHDHVHG